MNPLARRPNLADLIDNPALATEVDLDRVPDLLGEMERLRALLWARLALPTSRPDSKDDRLLSVHKAATILGTTRDWLRRNGDRLPFRVRLSAGQVQYSAKGIDRWIANRVGGRKF